MLIMRELDLIRLYYYLCECYENELRWHCQRFSNNSSPSNEKITDSELLTIYFYCRLYEDKHKKTEIYDYTVRYMSSWFPKLPNYSNFNARINALNPALSPLVLIILQDIENQWIIKGVSHDIVLVDSYPIILCSGKRQGKVATELSDKSLCATKNLYYYGVKMHMVACKVEKTIPLMDFVSITSASENDWAAFRLTALRPILHKFEGKAILGKHILNLPNPTLFLDTIYIQEAKASSEVENIITTNDKLYQSLIADEIKNKLPKIYSKDLIEILFRLPYTKR